MKYKCQDCDREIEKPSDWDHSRVTCKECNGAFYSLSDSDAQKLEDEETEDEEDTFSCDECEEDVKEVDLIQFESAGFDICKPCIDKAYPRQKERIVEKQFIERPKSLMLEDDSVSLQDALSGKSRFE